MHTAYMHVNIIKDAYSIYVYKYTWVSKDAYSIYVYQCTWVSKDAYSIYVYKYTLVPEDTYRIYMYVNDVHGYRKMHVAYMYINIHLLLFYNLLITCISITAWGGVPRSLL